METLFLLPYRFFSQGLVYQGDASGSKGLLPESGKAETWWPGCGRVCKVLGGGGRSYGQEYLRGDVVSCDPGGRSDTDCKKAKCSKKSLNPG